MIDYSKTCAHLLLFLPQNKDLKQSNYENAVIKKQIGDPGNPKNRDINSEADPHIRQEKPANSEFAKMICKNRPANAPACSGYKLV